MKSFSKILTIIVSANIFLTLRILLPSHKCKTLKVGVIFLHFYVTVAVFDINGAEKGVIFELFTF
jgi:hypothetical protein